MVKNKYDFQVGDIIIEEDRSWDIPSSCFMYHILDVTQPPPSIFMQEKKYSETPTTSSFMKHQYLPDDCSLTVMYTNVSGSGMFDKQFEQNGEGAIQTQFLFSKSVWDKSQNIRKIRGDTEYLLIKDKWIKR